MDEWKLSLSAWGGHVSSQFLRGNLKCRLRDPAFTIPRLLLRQPGAEGNSAKGWVGGVM